MTCSSSWKQPYCLCCTSASLGPQSDHQRRHARYALFLFGKFALYSGVNRCSVHGLAPFALYSREDQGGSNPSAHLQQITSTHASTSRLRHKVLNPQDLKCACDFVPMLLRLLLVVVLLPGVPQ
jgi:hypothetical protein